MYSVDIAQPLGMLALALSSIIWGSGLALRRIVLGSCLLFTATSLLLCAVLRLGRKSRFTFYLNEDVQQYKFARLRWLEQGMSAETWWVRSQIEMLLQCFANMTIVTAPFAVAAFNSSPQIHIVEVIGIIIWVVCRTMEYVAKIQKRYFLGATRAIETHILMALTATSEDVLEAKDDYTRKTKRQQLQRRVQQVKFAVVGFGEFSGPEYTLWTLCRHPNHFFAFMGWISLVLAAAPSLADLRADSRVKNAFALLFYLFARYCYDFFVHWIGAGPSEHFSSRNRPDYKKYQQRVRCFFPLPIPLVHHYQLAGWPDDGGLKED